MSDVTNRLTDISEHPDVGEMRERYRQILDRGQAVVVDGLVLLVGLYLALSPWIIGFSATTRVTVNNLILGIAVALIGLGLASSPVGMFRLSWAMVGIGIWAIVLPWVMRFNGDRALWISNVVAGGLTAILGLSAIGILMTARGKSRKSAARARNRRTTAER